MKRAFGFGTMFTRSFLAIPKGERDYSNTDFNFKLNHTIFQNLVPGNYMNTKLTNIEHKIVLRVKEAPHIIL